MTVLRILVEPADFDTAAELERLGGDGVGAVASFIGLVRGGDGLVSLTLEHWPGRTEAALARIAEEAAARWPLVAVTIVHRIGPLAPGARIVLVAASSSHRAAAIEAVAFLIDWLKTDAPFWKREAFADGTTRWVEARQSDDAASARWH